MIYTVDMGHKYGPCPDRNEDHVMDSKDGGFSFEDLAEAIAFAEANLRHKDGTPRGFVQVGHRAKESDAIWESESHYHSDALWRNGERMSDPDPNKS